MAVFQYIGVTRNKEGHTEQGTVVARDRLEAFDKLKRRQLEDIKLKRIQGLEAYLRAVTADIK